MAETSNYRNFINNQMIRYPSLQDQIYNCETTLIKSRPSYKVGDPIIYNDDTLKSCLTSLGVHGPGIGTPTPPPGHNSVFVPRFSRGGFEVLGLVVGGLFGGFRYSRAVGIQRIGLSTVPIELPAAEIVRRAAYVAIPTMIGLAVGYLLTTGLNYYYSHKE